MRPANFRCAGEDTTYITTRDDQGNWVSMIQSVHESFGCGIVADGEAQAAAFALAQRLAYVPPATARSVKRWISMIYEERGIRSMQELGTTPGIVIAQVSNTGGKRHRGACENTKRRRIESFLGGEGSTIQVGVNHKFKLFKPFKTFGLLEQLEPVNFLLRKWRAGNV